MEQSMPEEMKRAMVQIQGLMADFVADSGEVTAEELIRKINLAVDRMGYEMIKSGSLSGTNQE